MARAIDGFQAVPNWAVALLGARDLEEQEEAALAQSQITRVSISEAPTRLIPLLQSMRPSVGSFYLHLDLDALDSADGRGRTVMQSLEDSRAQILLHFYRASRAGFG